MVIFYGQMAVAPLEDRHGLGAGNWIFFPIALVHAASSIDRPNQGKIGQGW